MRAKDGPRVLGPGRAAHRLSFVQRPNGPLRGPSGNPFRRYAHNGEELAGFVTVMRITAKWEGLSVAVGRSIATGYHRQADSPTTAPDWAYRLIRDRVRLGLS